MRKSPDGAAGRLPCKTSARLEPFFESELPEQTDSFSQTCPKPAASRISLTPDIDFLPRQGVPDNLLLAAARLATMRGTQARQELFAAGFDQGRYWSMLSAHLGLAFVTDLSHAELVTAQPVVAVEAVRDARSALVRIDGQIRLIQAPGRSEIDILQAALKRSPALAARIAIAAPETIRDLLVKRRRAALNFYTLNRLARVLPRFSAQRIRRGAPGQKPKTLASVTLGLLLIAPGAAIIAASLMLAAIFANCCFWKLAAALYRATPLRLEPVPSRELPSYTVLVPLYREAAIVPDLLDHLTALDYPASKLQILLVVEADDAESRAAIAGHAASPLVEVLPVPPVGPRTKPKALTYALPFVRGAFVVVYDAEDRPEPDQLRKAAAAFRDRPNLGCVQARLQPDNQDSWLARMFTLEYAANFEVLLPALAAWGVPVPLGGTSNHFPRGVLERVCAWDPFNVTEDADLGIRLARFGYKVATIDSRTYEEAPVKFRQWLPQRRRWMKGWMQTSLLCFAGRISPGMRLSWRQNLAVHGILTGGVLGLLLFPVSLLALAATVHALSRGDWPLGAWGGFLLAVTFGNFLLILLAAILSALRGLRATGALRLAVLIPCLLPYWALMSVAAWQAVFQLLRAPEVWEKTTHGIARRVPRSAATAP